MICVFFYRPVLLFLEWVLVGYWRQLIRNFRLRFLILWGLFIWVIWNFVKLSAHLMLAPLAHFRLPYLLLRQLSLSDLFPKQLCARTVAFVPPRHTKRSVRSVVKIWSFIANMLFCIIHNLFNYKNLRNGSRSLLRIRDILARTYAWSLHKAREHPKKERQEHTLSKRASTLSVICIGDVRWVKWEGNLSVGGSKSLEKIDLQAIQEIGKLGRVQV